MAKRSTAILGLSGGVVAPLCFLKSLSALSLTSLLGVFAVIFSSTVMGFRFFDGSYALPSVAAPLGGKFVRAATANAAAGQLATATLPLLPSFGATARQGWKMDHMAFVLLSCLSTSFLCHFNAPTFYNDLKHKTQFNKVAKYGFGISTAVFAAMMGFGFATFGSSTLGNVFVNYSTADTLGEELQLGVEC
jgi:amino acid permease